MARKVSSINSSFFTPAKPSFARKLVTAVAVAGALPLAAVATYKTVVDRGCATFFKNASVAFDAPGLADGFVPQDVVYIEKAGFFFLSGYSADETKSPLYLCPPDRDPYPVYVELPDGSLYRGHGAAVADNGDELFLTTDTGYMILSLDDVLNTQPGGSVKPIGHRSVDLTPAFMAVYGDTLYLGVFYYPWIFATPERMHITTPAGQHNKAVMYAFHRDKHEPGGFAQVPYAVYTLPDKVQGMVVLPDGRFVFSCSVFFNNSQLLVYDARNASPDGTYMAEWSVVPRYDLDNRTLSKVVTAPPMSEGITLHNDHVYLTFESASKLYKVGALTQGRHVFALPIDVLG